MADCKTVSYPLVINGEHEGVFIPVLHKKIKKYESNSFDTDESED